VAYLNPLLVVAH